MGQVEIASILIRHVLMLKSVCCAILPLGHGSTLGPSCAAPAEQFCHASCERRDVCLCVQSLWQFGVSVWYSDLFVVAVEVVEC